MAGSTDTITSATQTQAQKDKSAEATRKSLATDFDSFLKLLTTQLKNQDPTAPLDTNQFTQQIVSFTGVEQQVNTNSNLEKLLKSINGSQLSSTVGYIGKSIETDGNQGILSNGAAYFRYDLPQAANSVSVSITDSTGKQVFTGQGKTDAGKNLVVWDGKNSTTGAASPDGTYTFTVTAKDGLGKAITAKTFTTGTVTAVDTQSGSSKLLLGDLSVDLSKVLVIRDPNAQV